MEGHIFPGEWSSQVLDRIHENGELRFSEVLSQLHTFIIACGSARKLSQNSTYLTRGSRMQVKVKCFLNMS
jgi:hypothetical protein